MTDSSLAAGMPAATADTQGCAPRGGGRWSPSDQRARERERLERRARDTDATAQLMPCFAGGGRLFEQLTWPALVRLAANEPVDPNDPDTWRSRDAHAQAVLRRHGRGQVSAARLTSPAIGTLIEGQALADRDAGLD